MVFRFFVLAMVLCYSSCGSLMADSMCATLLPSTEADPDAFIANVVNVINGDYCESATDLVIAGPDALLLQRYYNARNYVTGKESGSWRIFPQTLLIVGRDPQNKEVKVGQEQFEWSYAFTGERSGGILSYSGWKKKGGDTKDPLKIDPLKDGAGMVNSYAKEISGQTNHLNNRMHFKNETCELVLGDGTKRVYQKINFIPEEIFGDGITSNLASKVLQPTYYLLQSETLPSGNIMLFNYNDKGFITLVEIKDASQKKSHSWVRFDYVFDSKKCLITAISSDEKSLTYHFDHVLIGQNPQFILRSVKGNFGIPVTYEYEIKNNHCFLTKKQLPEGRFLEIEYTDLGQAKALKGPSAQNGKPESAYLFSYGDKFTDVTNACQVKTKYRYDDRLQLTAIEQYDPEGKLYRVDKKYFGKTKQDLTLLLACIISDGKGKNYSYRCFKYDGKGNVLEEKLYGNLTGKNDVSLQLSDDGQLIKPENEECHFKTFGYSEDGYNLLIRLGDCKGNKTTYSYEKDSNRLSKKLIYQKDTIEKREFRYYNTDSVCIKVIEDDGSIEEDKDTLWIRSERHITEIYPKETLPGIGLPERIEEIAVDKKTKQKILVKKLRHSYSPQGQLLSCSTYDSNDVHAFTVRKSYNNLGQVTSEIDPEGRVTSYSYDEMGNQVLISIPHENKTIEKRYDYKNNLNQTIESSGTLQKIIQDTYDILGRKIASTDPFGQTTHFEYDPFGHLIKIIYPIVLDEHEKPIQPTFSYTYDIFGNVLSITDPKGYTTYKTYNLRGNPTKIHYPDGSMEMFKYDAEGSLHRSLNRESIITVYEYDYLGRVSYEEESYVQENSQGCFITGREYKYSAFRLLSLRNRYFNSHEILTLYRHDTVGRVSAIVKCHYGTNEDYPESRKTEFCYDSIGRENKWKIWFGFGPLDYSVECFEYDLCGNTIEKRTEDAAGNILLRKGFAYDSAGRCVEEYAFSNNKQQTIIKTFYNPFGEPISYIDASGNETTVQIDYGKNNLKKTIIDPEGVHTSLEFDALGRIISVVKQDAKGTLLSYQNIFYDGVGNKSLEENAVIANGKQINIQKTRWIYGPMGRIEELIEAEGSPVEKRTAYSYNTLGQLVTKTLPNTTAPITYSYTKQGWLVKVHHQEGKNDPSLSNSYSYDRRGNITSATAQGITVERTYDIFNQVLQETVKDVTGKYTLTFKYDRTGKLTSIALPDNSTIIYSYDGVLGKEVKRLSSREEELYSHAYTQYDEAGRLLEETLIGYCGNRHNQYDLNGRKILVETNYCTERVPTNGYSALGNLLTIQRKGDFPTENSSFIYNSLSQLIAEKNGIQNTYSYDSIDNRIKENKEELLYNNLNQLLVQAQAKYSYDPQGNLLRKTLDGEETQFEFNILSELTAIEKSDHTFLTFSYDPFGRRVVKKIYDSKDKNKKPLSTTRTFYLGHHELGNLNENDSIKNLRVPGLSGSQISNKSIAIEINNRTFTVLYDLSGNVIALLDPTTCEIVESYSYSAFGSEKIYNSYQKQIFSSAIGNPWRYAEKPIDEETRLIYFGFRYYDPSISRWISKDPAGCIDGPNLYAYCHNNPLKNSDNFGLASVNEEKFYGEIENHCYCEHHRNCKRGGDIGQTTASTLPMITYCDDFEQRYPTHERSKVFDLGLKETENIGIGFINGVWNDFDSARANAEYLSKLAGGYNVRAVYNATHGKLPDLKECRMGLNYIASEPVRLLHEMWNSFFEKSSEDAKFIMVCHSQGAIHVRNALLDFPPELRSRIIVVAIAPAAYIYQKTCAQVTHYRNESALRDIIPRIDDKGARREKETIINVKSHPDASFFDHEFQSATYRDALIDELKFHLRGKK